jgi:hypothetical protein
MILSDEDKGSTNLVNLKYDGTYGPVCNDNAHQLDGSSLRITEVFLPDSATRSMRALYYCNCSYAYAEIVASGQDAKIENNESIDVDALTMQCPLDCAKINVINHQHFLF